MAMWMMSNRQPWTHAVVKGMIRTKTRNKLSMKPNDIVWLHASIAPWELHYRLNWPRTSQNIVWNLPRGGVYGVGLVEAVGPTEDVMPPEDRGYFDVMPYHDNPGFNCAMPVSVRFSRVIELPQVICPGRQNPVKKLPDELVQAIATVPGYKAALEFMIELGGTV